MKKILSLVLLITMTLTIASCSDDKDESIDYNAQLLGTWFWENTISYEGHGTIYGSITIVFKSDTKSNWTIYTEINGKPLDTHNSEFDYSYDGKDLKIFFSEDNIQTLKATLEGNKLTIDFEGETPLVFTKQ